MMMARPNSLTTPNMASLSKPPLLVHNPLTSSSSHALIGPAALSFPKTTSLLRARLCALKSGARRQKVEGTVLLPKRLVKDMDGNSGEDKGEEGKREDKILEDTVPLVGFVRMILFSGKYESGDRLSPEHQKTVLERLLPFHPEAAKKIGCGIDYVTVGYHPDFESSRCLFIVQKDGTLVDFSYWKCIKGLIRKNHPLYADRGSSSKTAYR